MFYTYILQSLKSHRYYIGHTQDLQERLERHQSGKVTATRNKGLFTPKSLFLKLMLIEEN